MRTLTWTLAGVFLLGAFGPPAQPSASSVPSGKAASTDPAYVLRDCPLVSADGAGETTLASGDEKKETTPGKVDALDLRKAYERANRLLAQTKGKVFKATITPNWFLGNKRFWYRNDLKGGVTEFIVVDAEKGTRQPAFDHAKLAASLSKASGAKVQPDRLPFSTIQFSDEAKVLRFTVSGTSWQCDLDSYSCERASKTAVPEETDVVDSPPRVDPHEARNDAELPDEDDIPLDDLESPQAKKGKKGGTKFGPPPNEATSPNEKWTVFTKESNVYLRDADGKETKITSNGAAGNAFGSYYWSPDSQTVVAYRTEPGDNKEVYRIESSPKDQLAAKLHKQLYPRPGDKFPKHEMWLIDVKTHKPTQVDVERIDFRGPPRPRWSSDRKRFTFEKTDRGHGRFRIIEVDAQTGKTRDIYDEKAATFIDVYSFYYVQYLDETNEILLTSERDGYKHLYLIDGKAGGIKHQLTKGEYVVRGVDRVDAKKRQVWFRASGKNPDQDPYFIHFYRVNFDGSDLVALTEGDGNHAVEYSPDGKFLIDTYSRVDMAPVHELRSVVDGKLVCALDKADISALLDTGWKAPEVFVAKARDGKTDIWGVVCRPQNLDPKKQYPVIELIYAGPQGSFAPKTFAAYRQMQALAELGFIVVQMDGMGTANRSRAFHDVCAKNLADAGFPDRILWIKALAKKYAYVDTSRVGIFGTSAGGQNAMGAVLFHPEFYKVAVASCGCHDNRLDKASWNEQWMGLFGKHYEEQSNVTNAHKLKGKLLLLVGELDTNVPPESTMRVVDALIRARKDFDLIVLPGVGHSGGGPYGDRRRMDFFVRHLLGAEPPDRNAE